jgi:hypothetical protein
MASSTMKNIFQYFNVMFHISAATKTPKGTRQPLLNLVKTKSAKKIFSLQSCQLVGLLAQLGL